MLVLTRKKEQMIQIGDDIIVKVIRTGRNQVKIGIDAPDDTRILRSEVAATITDEESEEAEEPEFAIAS